MSAERVLALALTCSLLGGVVAPARAQDTAAIDSQLAEALGHRVAESMSRFNQKVFNAALSPQAFVARFLSEPAPIGSQVPAQVALAVRRGDLGYGFRNQLMADRARYRFLGLLPDPPRLLFRLAGPEQLNYHELLLTPYSPEGTPPQIADVFVHSTGEWLSATYRRLLSDEGPLLPALRRAEQLSQEGKSAEALQSLDSLPREVRQTPAAQLARVRIARRISLSFYAAAVGELAQTLPKTTALALQQLTLARLQGRPDRMEKPLYLLERELGRDPYLTLYWARVDAHLGRHGRAQLRLERADAADPKLAEDVAQCRVELALVRKDWPAVAAGLDVLAEKFHGPVADRFRGLSRFKDFLASGPGRRWQAAQR